MVGQGVLRECLLDPTVTEVLAVGRTPVAATAPKLHQLVLANVGDLAAHAADLKGFDATFWPLGTSSVGKSEAEYRAITYDLTLAAATSLAAWNPGSVFVYVSGAGTDSSERGRSMWARVKGATENALARLPFGAVYCFRPGIIQPRHGIRSRTTSYRVLYVILSPIVYLMRAVAPNWVTTTDRVGRAMIAVARDRPADRILGNREINRLGSAAAPGAGQSS